MSFGVLSKNFGSHGPVQMSLYALRDLAASLVVMLLDHTGCLGCDPLGT